MHLYRNGLIVALCALLIFGSLGFMLGWLWVNIGP
jgi:hypothetical protein